jgi:hypothetical protein
MVSTACHPGEEHLGPLWRVIRTLLSAAESQEARGKSRERFSVCPRVSVVNGLLKSKPSEIH